MVCVCGGGGGIRACACVCVHQSPVTVPAGYNYFHINIQLKGSKQGVVRGFYDSLVQRFNSSDINGPKQAVNEHVTAYSAVFDWE